MKNKTPQCAELYWIELDPTVGTEVRKRRPCVILSRNSYNKYSTRVIAAPITSQVKDLYPCEVAIDVNGRAGKVMLDQIRTLDKQRLCGKIGELDSAVMMQIAIAFKAIFDFL